MRRITVALLLYLLFTSPSAYAQVNQLTNFNADFKENPSVIPFRLVYKFITIEATINGITGYLCLDTGIKGLVIRDKYFNSGWSENILMSSNGKTVIAGRLDAIIQLKNFSMNFPGASVINLDHLIPNESTQVLGFVGWDVFDGFELQIDYRNKLLRLFQLDQQGRKIGPNKMQAIPIQAMPIQFNGPLPFVRAKIGDQTLCLILDTGATVNAMRKSLYKRLSEYYTFQKMIKLRAWDGVFNAPLTEVSGMMLGDIPLHTMKTVWYDMSNLNEALTGPVIDGIIGQELMKQYLLAINFTTLELLIYPYEDTQWNEDVLNTTEELIVIKDATRG